jgi:negative regulator of replication initiation
MEESTLDILNRMLRSAQHQLQEAETVVRERRAEVAVITRAISEVEKEQERLQLIPEKG